MAGRGGVTAIANWKWVMRCGGGGAANWKKGTPDPSGEVVRW